MENLSTIFVWLDYAAVFVFGVSGALAAARRKHDIVTFTFFAGVTGVGGGTLRDLLIDAPVFWVVRPEYLAAALAAAITVWVFGAGKARLAILAWVDAVGLAAYAIVGAAKALAFGVPAGAAVVMGVLTATFGGVLRDVLAEEPSILLKREIYVSAALIGAVVFVVAQSFGAPELPASLAGFAAAFGVRAGAIIFRWSLPGFPGRATPNGEDEGCD